MDKSDFFQNNVNFLDILIYTHVLTQNDFFQRISLNELSREMLISTKETWTIERFFQKDLKQQAFDIYGGYDCFNMISK